MITHPSPALICVCQYSLTQQKAQRFLLRLPHLSAPIYLPRAKQIIPHTHFASGESIVGTQCVHCVYFSGHGIWGEQYCHLGYFRVLRLCVGFLQEQNHQHMSVYLLLWIYKPVVYLSI